MTIKKNQYGLKDLEKRFGHMTLGMYIKAFREADGASQISFAKKLGLSSGNLCDLEHGRKFPTPIRAARIAKKLGVSEAMLIRLTIQDSLRANNLRYNVKLSAA